MLPHTWFAYVRAEDRARALAAGFNMFVQKPVDPGELLSVIATLARTGARTSPGRAAGGCEPPAGFSAAG